MADQILNIVDDTMVTDAAATTNYGTLIVISAGKSSGSTYMGLFRLPAPTLGAGEAVGSVKLRLTRYNSPTAGTLEVHRITSTWAEGTVTWNTRPTTELVKTVTESGGATNSVVDIDITNSYHSTNGVALKRVTADTTLSQFHSSDATTSGYRPQVVYEIVAAGTPVNVNADPMTGSAAMPDATASSATHVSASGQPMTASASMPDAVGEGNVETRTASISEDTYIYGVTNHGSEDILVTGGANNYRTLIKLPITLGPNEVLVSATLNLFRESFTTSSGTVNVYKMNADWSEGTVTSSNLPASTFIKNVSDPGGAVGSQLSINLNDVVGTATYGILLNRSAQGNFGSSENATTARRPTLTYVVATYEPEHVNPTTTPASGSATMPDATVVTNGSASIAANPMTASAGAVDPTVIAQRHASFDASTLDANAEMPGGGFAVPGGAVAEVMTADATSVDATVATIRNANPFVEPAVASSRFVAATHVNGQPILVDETEDAYFNRVITQVTPNQPNNTWLRLGDGQAALIATDRFETLNINVQPHDYAYTNVDKGRFDGPAGRQNVRFTGSGHIRTTNAVASLAAPAVPTTVEFTFRTTKRNQFIMGGGDLFTFTGQISQSDLLFYREFRLKNGRIDYRAFDGNVLVGEMVGFRDLADNEWHHVVIRGSAEAVDVFVDGNLEIRRLSGNFGTPQYPEQEPVDIAGSDTFITIPEELGGTPNRPQSDWFVGDLTEFVGRQNYHLSDTDIQRNYYHVMGYNPFYAEAATADATMAEAKGRGNQKRGLYLYFYTQDTYFSATTAEEAAVSWGDRLENNPIPLFTSADYKRDSVLAGPFLMFRKSVLTRALSPTSTTGVEYRDKVTDEPRFIDLEQDLDIEDYDFIVFKDWPEWEDLEESLQRDLTDDRERLVAQLRWAVEQGVSLWVNNRNQAVDLGIVNRVEFVSPLTEGVGSFNTDLLPASVGRPQFENWYDYGSAVKWPWHTWDIQTMSNKVVPAMTATEREILARVMEDHNANTRYRVRALIPGLTDRPGIMVADTMHKTETGSWPGTYRGYKYLHRPDGLLIGDEFHYNGNYNHDSWSVTNRERTRRYGTWAAPLANVLVGTVVTTFGAKHWVEQSEVENPYRDYATSIAIEPEDEWGGRPAGGKVFVEFTETPALFDQPHRYHVVSEEIKNRMTDEQREWELAIPFIFFDNLNVGSVTPSVNYVLNPETGVAIPTESTEVEGGLVMGRSGNLFPLANYNISHMTRRGLLWLSETAEQEPGDKVVRASVATAEGAMPEPTVTARKSVSVVAPAMYASAVLAKPAEDESGDVEVRALPMTAAARITGYGKNVSAEPMIAHAALVENFDDVFTSGDEVVLFLHHFDATLFVKEEA